MKCNSESNMIMVPYWKAFLRLNDGKSRRPIVRCGSLAIGLNRIPKIVGERSMNDYITPPAPRPLKLNKDLRGGAL